jgi:hypothetical protein
LATEILRLRRSTTIFLTVTIKIDGASLELFPSADN